MKTFKLLSLIAGLLLSVATHAQYEVAIEIESAEAKGLWVKSTEKAGYSGDAYYYWSGGTKFNSPASGSDLEYSFYIPTAGSYRIYVRGMRERGAYGCPSNAENDRCNDIWLKIDDGTWTKKMIKQGWGSWIWDDQWEPGSSVIDANHTFTTGMHTIKLSGRSFGTMVDALVLTKDNSNPPSGVLAGEIGLECEPWYGNGPWKGKGRIAISSDGNEHDHDDWAATPLSLALLASKGLQDQLILYTFSDHIWGSNNDYPPGHNRTDVGAKQEMIISAMEGKEQFGFDNSLFIEAVEYPDSAYNAMRDAINASSADNPLFILGAGPMHVIGEGIDRANADKRQYVTVISHSNWNNRHSDNPSNGENHSGWTWNDMTSTFNTVEFIQILDQNGGDGYEGLRAPKEEYDWIKNSSYKNHAAYKTGSWDWLYARQETVIKSGDFDPSDAGMVVYLLTGIEKTDPTDAQALMESPEDTCGGVGSCSNTTLNGISDFTFPAANATYGAKGSLDNTRQCVQINTNQETAGEWARATATFDGESGSYTIKFNSLLESDGESSYKVKVNGVVVHEVANIRIDESRDYEIYSTQTAEKVVVNNGDEIQVDFLSATNGLIPEEGAPQGTAWARARWKSVVFECENTPPPPPSDCIDPADALGDATNAGHTTYAEMSIPGVIFAENFDDGGQGVSYEDKGYGNNDYPDGFRASWSLTDTDNFRDDVLLDIHTKNTAEGLFIGGIKKDEWAEYTVNIEEDGDYTLTTIRYATNGGITGKGYFKINDSVSCNVMFPNTGGSGSFDDINVNIVFKGLTAGEHVFAWVSTADMWNLDKFVFEKGIITNAPQKKLTENVQVYPNPFNNNLVVKTNASNITLYNLTGQQMHVETNHVEGGFELNTNTLAKGMYFIQAGDNVIKAIKE